MDEFRQVHIGTMGEAPVRFFERDGALAELPWVSAIDVFASFNLPADRFPAILESMARDFAGSFAATANAFVITQPVASQVLLAAIVIGKKFDHIAWRLEFGRIAGDAIWKIASRLPPFSQRLFVEMAYANTWGTAR